ncbi:hypothetical protein EMGBS15_09450 [Filimonas sp.]|jgi:hypothetical protein|nr:hypothetical protein EMGBS15_09450 [Filimonas sp.]
MKKFLKNIFLILIIFCSSNIIAQKVSDSTTHSVVNSTNLYELAIKHISSFLRQNEQLNLVVLVLVTIFAGIIFLLLRIERKLNRLEKKQENKQS